MTTLILGIFLVCGVLGFSRYVVQCRVTDVNSRYSRCRSLDSGKYFTFTDGIFDRLEEGYTYTVEFYGNGYNNLYLEDAEFVD